MVHRQTVLIRNQRRSPESEPELSRAISAGWIRGARHSFSHVKENAKRGGLKPPLLIRLVRPSGVRVCKPLQAQDLRDAALVEMQQGCDLVLCQIGIPVKDLDLSSYCLGERLAHTAPHLAARPVLRGIYQLVALPWGRGRRQGLTLNSGDLGPEVAPAGAYKAILAALGCGLSWPQRCLGTHRRGILQYGLKI